MFIIALDASDVKMQLFSKLNTSMNGLVNGLRVRIIATAGAIGIPNNEKKILKRGSLLKNGMPIELAVITIEPKTVISRILYEIAMSNI